MRDLPQFTRREKTTAVPITFEPYQSFFVVFPRKSAFQPGAVADGVNFPEATPVQTLDGAWEVAFDPKWGGPEKAKFDALQDWTTHPERGVKYYSGIATYRKTFGFHQETADSIQKSGQRFYLDLGTVQDMARVRLNGKDLGVVWCAPWRVEITDALEEGENQLKIEVANRWPNRLLGDQQPPDKNARTVRWESGFLGGKEHQAGRYTFATTNGPGKLLPSGLLGPVKIQGTKKH
jgi:hypothetical protein